MRNEKTLRLEYEDVQGQVAAGSILPFTPKSGKVHFLVPNHLTKAEIGMLEICGPSLEDLGIYSGDILIYTTRFNPRDVLFERVCVVHILTTGEIVAKKILPAADDHLTLRASGGGVKDVFYHRNEIEVKGVMISFIRLWENVYDRQISAEFGF